VKTILNFEVINKRKHHSIIVASLSFECCCAGNFGLPVLILKYLKATQQILMRIAELIPKKC